MKINWNVHQVKLLKMAYLSGFTTVIALVGVFAFIAHWYLLGIVLVIVAYWMAMTGDRMYRDLQKVLNTLE